MKPKTIEAGLVLADIIALCWATHMGYFTLRYMLFLGGIALLVKYVLPENFRF